MSNWCSAKVDKYGNRTRHPNYPNDVEGELVPHWGFKDAWQRSKRVGPITDLIVVAAREVHNNALISGAQALWRVIPRSDPRIPLPAHYGFIVNAISDRGDNDPVYVKSLLNAPDTISNGLVSASYITSEVNTVWASSGFILDVPERNIFAAGTQNLATKSHVGHMHMARKYVEMLDIFLEPRPRPRPVNTLLPPSELITSMKIMRGVNKYMQMNEMVILGTAIGPGAEFSRVRVVGIFVMEDDKQPSPQRMQIYKRLSRMPHNLPIVKLHLAATSTVKAN